MRVSRFDRKAQGGSWNFIAQSVILDVFRNKTRLIQFHKNSMANNWCKFLIWDYKFSIFCFNNFFGFGFVSFFPKMRNIAFVNLKLEV